MNNIDDYQIPRVYKHALSGKTFNKLTAMKIVGKSKNNTNLWQCRCECGNIRIVPTSNLLNNRTKSCGCLKTIKTGKNHHLWKGIGTLSGNKWQAIKHCARFRNIIFEITKEDVWAILEKQNFHCVLSHLPINFDNKSASIDRINSKIGYILNNIWIVHKDINLIKSTLDISKFYKYCELVYSPSNINNTQPSLIIFNSYMKDLQHNAKKRDIDFQITAIDIMEIYCQQKYKCCITGLPIKFPEYNKEYRSRLHTASVDRIDCNKSYTIDNIQIVHKEINQSRKHLTMQRYIELCTLVHERRVL